VRSGLPADGFDVVEAYARPSLGAPTRWDEMVDPAHGVRPAWREVGSVLRLLGRDGLGEQRRTVRQLVRQDGVTYRPYGARDEQAWSLDPVPLLLDEAEWQRLEPALAQRAELFDLILTDLYGPRRLLAEGLIPPEIVLGHSGFVRAADQIRLPGARQLFIAAADLARGPDGQWQVLGDQTQAPSGTGYAMANRRVISRSLPGLYRDTRIHRIGPFFQAMRVALQALAPWQAEVPRVVLLTSGAHSETAFDQAYLSTLLGFPLVEGNDLTVRDGQLWQRSIGRLEPVDVVLRRVDAWFCDPLELRPDSHLGVPGLVEAARLGNVSVVNGLGTGVLENPALYPFLPRLAEVLLGRELQLPSVQTWWCGDPSARQHVLANLDSLVIKPVSRRIVRTGSELSVQQRDELARRILAEPHAWVAQEAMRPSTAPGIGRSGLEARPMVLRSFAVSDGGSYRLLPGGLTESPGSGLLGTQDGAVAKDVWVLSSAPVSAEEIAAPELVGAGRVASAISPRVAEDMFWLGRYTERAEDVSRLVSVTDNRWHDMHAGSDPAIAACVEVVFDALLTVTSASPPAGDRHAQIEAVIGDVDRKGTLAHDVRNIRELANANRDQLSIDTWSVLSDLEHGIAPFSTGDGGDVVAAMTTLREALLAFAGLAAESMVRDAGWHFLDAGRRLERAVQIARLLRAGLTVQRAPAVAALVEESTLIAAESIITHRRRYPAQSGVETMLELLLLDRDNPRAIAYQLDRLGTDLRRVGASSDALQASVQDVSARLLAADCEALARSDETGRRAELDALLGDVVDELHDLALAIEAAHFAHRGMLRQLVPMAGFESLEAV
jgi:uncharacterized circularly permuted ATP-grasp superfamily protein/uncharacterized alpha-E superfamily protein